MRAIKIDPVSRTITEIDLHPNVHLAIEEMRSQIDAKEITVTLIGRRIGIVSCTQPKEKGFRFFANDDTPFFGAGIAVGWNRGKIDVLHEKKENFDKIIEWI